MNRRHLVSGSLVSCAWILTGCGEDTPSDTPSQPETTVSPQASAVAMSLGKVRWTLETDGSTGAPKADVTSFASDAPRIIAVVEGTSVPAGTTVTAEWTIETQPVPDAAMKVTVDELMARAWFSFTFVRAKDRYFPLGTLTVTITPSGGSPVTGSTTITLPANVG